MAEVGLGRVGAVLSLEASRLARSCCDWYRLIEVCGLTDTLVIDEDGVYDPTQYNDRLLLGIKGTMSAAELHWIRSRLLGGKLEKARTGQLRSRPPTGLVYDPAGQIVLDPDEQVQQALRLVFDTFERVGTALGVVQYFAKDQLRFPTRHYGGSRDGQLTWRPLEEGRVLAILHNPTYTGTYVYGRTKTRNVVLPGEEPRFKGRTRRVVAEDWPFVIHDHHPAYITWEQFQRNQRRLLDNCTFDHQERRGAIREGAALLQGLVLCGRCGRRMTIRYMDDGKIPLYECNQLHKNRGEKTCQSLRGDRIDEAVARVFLEAMRPAQLEVSMAAIDQISRAGAEGRPPVGVDGGAGSLRGGTSPAPVPGGRPRESPGRPDVGTGLGGEAGRGGTSGTGIGRTARAVDPPGGSRGACPDPGTGAGPALAVAGRDDDASRAQTTARILDQGCLPDAGRDDDRGGDPLADGGLHRLEHPSPETFLRCTPDRPRRAGSPSASWRRTRHGPPDRRDPRSGGIPIRDGPPFTTNIVI